MLPGWIRMALLGLFTLGVGGCGGQPETPPPPPAAEQSAKAPTEAPALDLKTLQNEAAYIALTPSPVEMQAALEKAGIAESLANLIKSKDIETQVPDKDQAAVRTGVVIADLVLTVREADKATVIKRLQRINEGMNTLGAGQDIETTIMELIDVINNDAISREKLVQKMDELSGAVIPEIEYEAGPQSVPLIQAGSWLEGANLVATAIRNTGKYESANTLLKQPEVVAYFLKYVSSDGQEKAPDEIIKKLETALTTLLEVTQKETLGEEEVKAIHVSTDSVLALL